ncbi:Eco57I restriction-modification methylase domain-containing protein [Lunatimonas salinarum]|uniref:Eco57I restriction-modification methylase domain-containing protein n=1 Tax=Lunatimonas salinarum TaxID=1774590 RepID=UPI001ADF9E56|nr:DNA methyltransferase [Lunatimonas salinarum]
MTFPSITIQGNIISGEILDKITSEDIKHQTPESFGVSKNIKIRDEIGLAWASARGYWQAFKLRRERIAEEDSGTTETRNFWMLPFLLTLGYEVDKANAANLDGKTYAISHRASNLSGFPVHIMGVNDSLDRRRETSGPRLSPHALVQEYLNKTDDYLYAIVTNGKQLRLLRDASRLVRLTYLEFDLEKMMEEELFADFALLYRVLHASRMPKEKSGGEESIIEFYHQESLASGTRIREKLSEAVESSIKRLGNGFLKHPDNQELRDRIQAGELTGKQYYLFLLRLIYRFLFLLVTEDRSLVYSEKRDGELTRLRKIYYDFYSMNRVRNLALRRIFVEGAKQDLWENIKITFRLFESAKYGEKLGIKPLGSGIFHPSALGVLSQSALKNEDLLFTLYRLCYFMDEDRKQVVKVNFGDLDVEEFGSVYQGLLEYEPVFTELETSPSFGFVAGTERSSSGSHYTPEELVRPLIQHSLEYIIQDCLEKPEERLQVPVNQASLKTLQEKALLGIKVADISCGSGHILLSAARRIGTELAKVRTGEDQPTPTALRQAVRDVIRECIYGVDKNPLAVELCKVALWLEAHNPGEPLNFLDHKIKCGDAIVGLEQKEELEKGIADEAFKALPGDDKTIATGFRKRNAEERKQKDQLTMDYSTDVNEAVNKAIEQFQLFKNLPERTPEEIEAKQKKFMELNKGTTYARLKSLADMQVAQFFIPKTPDQKSYICTDATYRKYLREKTIPTGMPPAKAEALAQEKGFFHYFLEFPEIFQYGGFDCILGNPPFLGGKKISGLFGDYFLSFIKNNFSPAEGGVDLVTYFFRRIFQIIKNNGFQSLISTSTISQGDSRLSGLEYIIKSGGSINFAIRTMKWPGEASVEVSLISITKGNKIDLSILNGNVVQKINSYLDFSNDETPLSLNLNQKICFYGTVILGKGFVIEEPIKELLINLDKKNLEVISDYLIGDDLNNSFLPSPRRNIINFGNMALKKASIEEWNNLNDNEKNELTKSGIFLDPFTSDSCASDYKECLEIVENTVKPERNLVKRDVYRKKWWQFAEKTSTLYSKLSELEFGFARCLTSKHHGIFIVKKDWVIDQTNVVFCSDSFAFFCLIQSSIHFDWVQWQSADMMGTGSRYNISRGFETFPFYPGIQSNNVLKEIGYSYYEYRLKLMQSIVLGVTKFYNLFHSLEVSEKVRMNDLNSTEKKTIETQFGKDVFSLWNHLQKTDGACSWDEAVIGISKLREIHKEMDEAVLRAYGWTDIQLRHGFHEVELFPENDRVRYTIHPDARKEILKRLLDLNHQYFEEEAKQGLHKQEDVEAFYEQKGKPVPPEVSQWFGKKKGKDKGPKEPKAKPPKPSPQTSLFEATTPLFSQPSAQKIGVGSKVTIRSTDAKEMKYFIQATSEKGSFTSDGYVILADSGLAQAMIGKGEGYQFEFGGMGYRVMKVE